MDEGELECVTRRWLGEATNLGRRIELPRLRTSSLGARRASQQPGPVAVRMRQGAGRMRGRRQQELRGGGVEAVGQHRAGERCGGRRERQRVRESERIETDRGRREVHMLDIFAFGRVVDGGGKGNR